VIKVYGDSRSGNCDKVRFTLDYLARPYEWVEVDSVSGQTRTEDYLRMNPLGQVPCVLLRDHGALAQSNAIIRHLATGSRLLPDDAWARAKIDEWMFWEANNHEFFVAGCIAHMTYIGGTKDTRDPMRVRRGEEALGVLDRHLAAHDWMVGEHLTVADIALLAYTRQAERGGFDLEGRPSLRAWIARGEAELGL
jgi:glutathione S-transferase